MQLFNRNACSPEFIHALDTVLAGGTARRTSWPEGQFLAPNPTVAGQIAVFRDHALSSPFWMARGDEERATDWVATPAAEGQ